MYSGFTTNSTWTQECISSSYNIRISRFGTQYVQDKNSYIRVLSSTEQSPWNLRIAWKRSQGPMFWANMLAEKNSKKLIKELENKNKTTKLRDN